MDSKDHGAGEDAGRRYGRRWIRRAFDDSVRFFGLHIGWFIATLLGPTIGFFLLAYLRDGTAGFDSAFDETAWLIAGVLGTLVLWVFVFIWRVAHTPAALERDAAVRAARQREQLERDAGAARRDAESLQQELDTSQMPEVQLIVRGDPLLAVDVREEVGDAFLEEVRKGLTESVKKFERTKSGTSGFPFAIPSIDFTTSETRSPSEFVEEAVSYGKAMSANWAAALRGAAIEQGRTPVRFTLVNPHDTGLEAVEVQLRLPDEVGAGWDEDAEYVELPDRPRPFGTQTLFSTALTIDRVPTPAEPGRIEREGSALVVTFDRMDLSANSRTNLPLVHIFIPREQGGGDITITWTVSSLPRRGVRNGRLVIPLGADLISPAELLALRDD